MEYKILVADDDTRNILKPSAISEGGRRLYSEDDVKRMEIICFLRETGISLNNIEELISGSEPEKVISILIEQQEKVLAEELEERQTKLELLAQIKTELKKLSIFRLNLSEILHMQSKTRRSFRKCIYPY